MDIHGYIHAWISDLGHAVDASTDVWYQCLISDTGSRINDFTMIPIFITMISIHF